MVLAGKLEDFGCMCFLAVSLVPTIAQAVPKCHHVRNSLSSPDISLEFGLQKQLGLAVSSWILASFCGRQA